MADQRPVIQRKEVHIPPKAIAAALVSLISAAIFYYFWVTHIHDLQRQLAEANGRASKQLADLGNQLGGLATGHMVLLESTELLMKVSIEDRSDLFPPLKELSDYAKAANEALSLASQDLALAKTSEKSGLPWQLRGAISDVAAVETSLAAVEREVKNSQRQASSLLPAVSSALREELSLLQDELRSFFLQLADVVRNVDGTLDPTRNLSDTVEGLRGEAIQLAQVAKIVYSADSLVQKGRALERRSESLEDVVQGVRVAATDRQIVADSIEDGRRTPPPAVIEAALGTKWRVTGAGLNLRKGQSAETEVICALNGGEEVEILKGKGYWWEVETRCGKGWVASRYLNR